MNPKYTETPKEIYPTEYYLNVKEYLVPTTVNTPNISSILLKVAIMQNGEQIVLTFSAASVFLVLFMISSSRCGNKYNF